MLRKFKDSVKSGEKKQAFVETLFFAFLWAIKKDEKKLLFSDWILILQFYLVRKGVQGLTYIRSKLGKRRNNNSIIFFFEQGKT